MKVTTTTKEEEETEIALQTNKVHKARGVVMHEGKVWIPDDKRLRTMTLTKYLDSSITGHVGIHKTLESLQRVYY